MAANDRQVGGNHYREVVGEQHWDRVYRLGLDYFQAMITRYVERHKLKNGLEDLKKARHFLDKYIELLEQPNGADLLQDQGANSAESVPPQERVLHHR